MIKNIIFDMGNVLMNFAPHYYIHQLGITGEDEELLIRRVFHTVEWFRLDRGTMTDAEAAESMCRKLPQRLHDAARQLVFHWDDFMLPIDGAAELVKELKDNGYGIYLLSNASVRQHEYWHKIPGWDLFDDTYVSADHHLVKPMLEIYSDMLKTFGLQAGECVFIDDNPVNMEAAYFSGLPGIVFHDDVAMLRQDLRDLGVNVTV